MPQIHKKGMKAISVWLDKEDRQLLKELVAHGYIKDRSAFIRKAIKEESRKKGLTNNV